MKLWAFLLNAANFLQCRQYVQLMNECSKYNNAIKNKIHSLVFIALLLLPKAASNLLKEVFLLSKAEFHLLPTVCGPGKKSLSAIWVWHLAWAQITSFCQRHLVKKWSRPLCVTIIVVLLWCYCGAFSVSRDHIVLLNTACQKVISCKQNHCTSSCLVHVYRIFVLAHQIIKGR